MIYECNSRDSRVDASTLIKMSNKRKKVVSVQHKLRAVQRLDKGEILRIVAVDYGVEKNTVSNWRRNHANLERFASNACGAMTNRKAMKLVEYDKIDSALFFLLDVLIDVRLSRFREYVFALICLHI